MATSDEVERIRWLLKRKFSGEDVKEALRKRLQIHLEDPLQDPLSRQVWGSYLKLIDIVEEPFSILDCGCMSGFLYHHLRRHKKNFSYTGIDRWAEAIEIGLEFERIDLRVADFLTYQNGEYDYVWCSNIPWQGNDLEKAKRHFLPMARKAVIFAHPSPDLEPRMEIYGA